ncbi:MaoC/PaaZ C-terminal domain-containing protein [Blastomonas sp. CCH2-E1]|uniref:MaoC/PaaZ C-terminal domain-containing protein n=1 Tax=Blastomonas sp. CCH2-E1 TaxID=1768740 RepID=UPI00082505EA|nr:MaoC/PaaZ C-terminal domain-containing protein [Blastomonas sp. CCH2-E1]
MAIANFNEVQIGDALPPITFGPITRTMLALYAGASGDHNPAHIDSDFAKKAGLPDVFAHGMLSFGGLTRIVTQWAGIERLRSFGARFVSMTQVHDLIAFSGRVVERFEADGETRLRISLVAAAQDGRQTLLGEAIVAAG